jgi:hypothetical protein
MPRDSSTRQLADRFLLALLTELYRDPGLEQRILERLHDFGRQTAELPDG